MPSHSNDEIKRYLGLTWNGMNELLPALPEETLKKMIKAEAKGKNRKYVIKRLHQRFTNLRRNRELKELLG